MPPDDLTADARRRWQRLLLLSTDPADAGATGRMLLAVLLDANHADIADKAEAELAARVLATSRCGLAGADDALLLQVARAAAATSNELPSVQHAALLHPPLSALVTVHCADWSDGTALMRWARGLWSTSPWRTLRLSATAAWQRWR